ncbi:acyltransferase [Nitrospira sp. KM1]|uniref:LpxL/LpxP family acyltransferase n=1 Tax=Nitrospira sp. KM1 TaxID=1936990 RepID=UPI0013A72EE3|nr:hypothetical protein [Nitrospira sp. KM1]BCA55716.1 acyltransferase [Nitrospira sp. KM1]
MNSLWLDQRERGSRRLILCLTWITLRLGRGLSRVFLYPICLYFTVFSGGTRRISKEYLEKVLRRRVGSMDVFRHFHTFASTIHDRVYLLSGKHRHFEVRIEGEEILEPYLEQKRGCILLGSHLGSFEMLRAHGLFERQLPISMVMHEGATPNLNAVLHNLNPAIRPRIISPGTPDTMLMVKERLDLGELVGILGDRIFRGDRAMVCTFLGQPTRFPEGPLLLAALLRAPVILFFGLYEGGRRYTGRFELLSEAMPAVRPRSSDDLRPWLERYVGRLEHHCRLYPYNWFNFHGLPHETQSAHLHPESPLLVADGRIR